MTQQQADTYREDVRKEYNVLVQQAAASNMAATMVPLHLVFLSPPSCFRLFLFRMVFVHLGLF